MPNNSRFAIYLVPPYPIVRDIEEIHSMLQKQFGIFAGGLFQVHCTIKGFFKKNEKSIVSLIDNLDAFFKDKSSFEVEFSGLRKSNNIVLELKNYQGSINQELLDFRENVVGIVKPFIASDCDFKDSDLGPPFRGHITLAFRDVPEELYDQVITWLKEAPIPQGSFTASSFHLLEFFSEDWDGPWWETISWKLHKAWSLKH